MISFELTTDPELIHAVVTHPAVFPFVFSDGGPTREAYEPSFGGVHYVAARVTPDESQQDARATLAGIFICIPQTSVCWEIHACLLPHARRRATEIYRAGLEWLRGHTACRKALGYIPAYNRAALMVAAGAGAKVIGINRRSILIGGELQDQIILGKEL